MNSIFFRFLPLRCRPARPAKQGWLPLLILTVLVGQAPAQPQSPLLATADYQNRLLNSNGVPPTTAANSCSSRGDEAHFDFGIGPAGLALRSQSLLTSAATAGFGARRSLAAAGSPAHASALGRAVLPGREILDGDDVQGIEGGDFAIRVEDCQAVAANEHEFRMGHGVFAPIGGPQAERAKAAGESLSNAICVHPNMVHNHPLAVNPAGAVISPIRESKGSPPASWRCSRGPASATRRFIVWARLPATPTRCPVTAAVPEAQSAGRPGNRATRPGQPRQGFRNGRSPRPSPVPAPTGLATPPASFSWRELNPIPRCVEAGNAPRFAFQDSNVTAANGQPL